jgi:hypothetical protein
MYRFALWENAALLTASRYRNYRFGKDLRVVHPRGFEPLTFGSVGQFFIENFSDAISCKTLENLGFPVDLRTIVLLPTFQILQRFAL